MYSLVIESNWKQSEQNPMSDSLCSRKALSNVVSAASERSIYTVGQRSAAFRQRLSNVMCDKPDREIVSLVRRKTMT